MVNVLALTVLLVSASGALGCGCGLMLPPPPCPPPALPMCPPMPPPCPPPPVCPPAFCPPPPICPPPPPPPPPAMCPPMPPPMACPMPVASPCGGYAPAPVYQPAYVMPPSNDCCCQCNRPCHYRARARSHGARIFSAPVAEVEEDPTCNSQKLRALMEDNITRDPSISKRAIQKAVEEKLFGKYNVICAKGDFSYVAYTETYCQTSNDDVTCYAFRPL